MARSSRTSKQRSNDYISQRAAGYLHDGVDRVAAQGERVERHLHDGYELLDAQAHRVDEGMRNTIGSHPWMAVSGSAVLGFLLGLMSGRRT